MAAIKKNISSKGLIIALMLALVFTLASCGGPKTLEEYVNSDADVKEQIEQISKSSGLKCEIKENTVIYTYTYEMELNDSQIEQMSAALEKALGSYESTFTDVIDTLTEETGIEGINIKVIYLDKAEKEILSKEYTK